MEIGKWKKKKEKSKLEGNSDSVYFCCKELAEIYFNTERFDDALNEYIEMKQISIQSNNRIDVGRADRMIGEVYCEKGEFKKAITHQKNHLLISRDEQDKVEEQRALATLGRTYFLLAESIIDSSSENRVNALIEAKKFYFKSLEVCNNLTEEKISSKQELEMSGRLFLNIGLVLDCQNQYEDAVNHMLKSVTICKKLDLWEDLYRTYSALGAIYQRHGDRQDALKTYDLALNVAERLGNKSQLVSEVLIQKSDVLLDLPDLRGSRQALFKAYKFKSSNDSLKTETEKKLRTVAAMCEFEDKLTDLPHNNCFAERKQLYENMGDAATDLNNYSLAITYYHLMLECVQKCGNSKEDLIASYVSLAQTYKDNNQLSNSLKYFKLELELEEQKSPEACKTLLNIAEVFQLMGNSEEMFCAYSQAKIIAFEKNDLKLKKIVLKSLYDALLGANRIKEAEETKLEMNNLQLNNLFDSSDEDEVVSNQFGADICLENLSDEEPDTTDTSKKAKLSRSRTRPKGNLEKRNVKGETPLHVAAINGNANLVKRLIEQGHSVDVKDYSGWTPLHEACNHGHKEVVGILLDNKAPINDRGGTHCDGVTPLLDAASNGSLDVIEILLSYGASALMRTNRGETVLDCLSAWKERRYNELGVDLDSITSSQYDSVYSTLKQILENAGQKMSTKDQSEPILSNMRYSRNNFSSLPKNNSFDIKKDKNESIAEDYQNTIKSFRRKNSNEKLLSPKTNRKMLPALLTEDETVGDEWLENDVDVQRPIKKRRIDEHDFGKRRGKDWDREIDLLNRNKKFYASDDEDSSSEDKLENIDDSSNDFDKIQHENNDMEENSVVHSSHKSNISESFRERFKEVTKIKKRQSSLLSAGIIKEKVSKTISKDHHIPQTNEPSSFSQQANFSCIKVKIEEKTIVVPIPQSGYELFTISWLEKEAADRYRRLEGTEPLLQLEMEEGGLLMGSDPLAILSGVPQIRANITSWKILALTGLYKEACESAGTEVDKELNELFEACQATSSVSFENMYLDKTQLTPILHTLSHHPPLQFLSIAGTNISDNFISELAESVSKLVQLRSFDMSNINITSKGLETFCQIIKKQNSLRSLEKIKLGYNPLGDCLRSLAELISLVPRLRYLGLPSVGITSHSFNNFIQFTLECLEVLDLSYNEIGGEGLTDILGRLETQTIVELRLVATGSQTIREIGFYLQRNTPLSLRALDVSYCSATELDIDCLIKGVAVCTNLEKLILDGLGQVSINLDNIPIKEVSLCGTKVVIGPSLPNQLKNLSLTSPSQECFTFRKGPYGLCKLST